MLTSLFFKILLFNNIYCLLSLSCVAAVLGAEPVPIVIWHGMGDSCCNPVSMGSIKGGQFLRAVQQRCPELGMKNLVTIGAQHQGVFGFPNCPGEQIYFCDIVRDLLNYGAYVDFVQNFLVQAQYWHDPLDLELHVSKSKFIAEINNEKPVKKPEYAENLAKLENFVMVKHTKDTMVEPRESEHFEFYAPDQAETIIPLRESQIYLEDWIGLKALDERGALHFLEVEGDHLEFTRQWFLDNIVNIYFIP